MPPIASVIRPHGRKEAAEQILIAAAIEIAVQLISSAFDEWRRRRQEKRDRINSEPGD